MALVAWRKEFSVGIPAVDHEHRELIDIINEVHERSFAPGMQATIMDMLGEIYARISAHFALEEKIMREREYDQYDDHKQDHERLLDEIRDIMDRYEDDAGFDEQKLSERLSDWFTVHFKTRDARLHRYLG